MGLAHRPGDRPVFQRALFLGQDGVILSITDFLPTLHTLAI